MALQLGPKDLMDKKWTIEPPDSDGKIGHFYSSRGRMRSSCTYMLCLPVDCSDSLLWSSNSSNKQNLNWSMALGLQLLFDHIGFEDFKKVVNGFVTFIGEYGGKLYEKSRFSN